MKLTKSMIKKLQRARNYQVKADSLTNEVITEIENKLDVLDLTHIKGGCNSNDLEQMIACYVQYKEDSIQLIQDRLSDIKGNE